MQRRQFLFSLRCAIALAIGFALLAPLPAQAQGKPVVFAAASLNTALDAIASDWQKQTGKSVAISYASSAALARQIEQGAPADIFISADLDWMDWAQERHLIKTETRERQCPGPGRGGRRERGVQDRARRGPRGRVGRQPPCGR
jgi:ABC-type molybdate transport system substrate-binding protein